MERQLLHTPEGVRDIHGNECAEKVYIQNSIHKVFNLYGFNDIQTPSFEFFDIFNKERGSVASKNMFKFFDREGNTLVLRPDMTPAIARCAAKYFEAESSPVRLSYIGNTFINNSRYQGRLKETTQAGCELIGYNTVESDAEMIALLVDSILSTGLENFQVEIGHIGFFKGLIEDAGLNAEEENEMRQVILNKNIFRVEGLLENKGLDGQVIESFYKLPQLFGEVSILEKAKKLTANNTSLNAIIHLEKVYELLKVYGFDKYVTFDLGMISELDYYTGVIFKAYTYDVGEPVANGGRYDKLIGQFGENRESIGFAITIDLLHQAIKRQKIKLPAKEPVKLLVYDKDNISNAIVLAGYFRDKGICVSLASKPVDASADRFDEIIDVNDKILERYGITK